MGIKLFADLIDALGKVAAGVKAIANVPKAEREAIHRTLDETYRLIDTTLNMVIIRLGDILLEAADSKFLVEAAKLDNYDAWITAEREFRLCRSLRVAERETRTLAGKLVGALSASDWGALLQQMNSILATEGAVATFIGQQFQRSASDARSASHSTLRTKDVRDALTAFRAALVGERQELIKQEVDLYTIV